MLKLYYRYSQERFPLAQFISLSLIFSLVVSLATQLYLGQQFNGYAWALTFLALFLFLFRLRLFDEFKDYQHDLQHYPQRPVARGSISLAQLKPLIFLSLGLEIAISASRWPSATLLFVVALLYSLIMFKEFFIADWLRRHFTIYIISHELLLVPLFFYLFSLNGFKFNQTGSNFFWQLLIFLAANLFILEVTRKCRPPELEIASRDTYTAQYGIKSSAWLVIILAIVVIMAQFGLLASLRGIYGWLSYSVFIFFGFLMWSLANFVRQPTAQSAKKVFKISIIFCFASLIIFIISLLV